MIQARNAARKQAANANLIAIIAITAIIATAVINHDSGIIRIMSKPSAGKGDSQRNIFSKKFQENYSKINWKQKPKHSDRKTKKIR